MKDYLSFEMNRNRKNRSLYERILKCAFVCEESSLIAHHLTFNLPGEQPNEIPAADTLIFDHEIMKRVFGERFIDVITKLAALPCDERDEELDRCFKEYAIQS